MNVIRRAIEKSLGGVRYVIMSTKPAEAAPVPVAKVATAPTPVPVVKVAVSPTRAGEILAQTVADLLTNGAASADDAVRLTQSKLPELWAATSATAEEVGLAGLILYGKAK